MRGNAAEDQRGDIITNVLGHLLQKTFFTKRYLNKIRYIFQITQPKPLGYMVKPRGPRMGWVADSAEKLSSDVLLYKKAAEKILAQKFFSPSSTVRKTGFLAKNFLKVDFRHKQ